MTARISHSVCIFFFLALSSLFYLYNKSVWWKIPLLSLAFGLAQSLRAAGFTLYVIWLLMVLYEHFLGLKERGSRQGFSHTARIFFLESTTTLFFACWVMLPTWPYLRGNFLSRLVEYLNVSAAFPMEVQFLFMGRMVSSLHLPWFYLPGWLVFSTPLFILILAVLSPFLILKPLKNRLFVFLSLTLIFHLLLIMLLRPASYVTARHFLYLLPVLTLLASLTAVECLGRWKGKRSLGMVPVVLNIVLVFSHLVRLHPYEYVYFNEITGGLPGAYGNFEIEDRGTSAREAVLWLKKNEFIAPDRQYNVTCYQEPFQVIYYLPPNAHYVKDWAKADYLITLPYSGHHRFNNPLLHSVSREGVALMDIYKKGGSIAP